MMDSEGRTRGVVLLCDTEGTVLQVIRDDLGLRDRLLPGRPLSLVVDRGSLAKALSFVVDLRTRGTACDWELNVPIAGQVTALRFFGVAADGELLIVAARSSGDVLGLCEDLLRTSDDQMEALRPVIEGVIELVRGQIDQPAERYDELSRLNNELANVQRELAKKNAELERVRFSIDHVLDSVLWVGSDGHFIDANDAACRNLGYTRDELLSMGVPDIDPNFPPEVWPSHWAEMKQRGTMTIESVHRTKEGRTFPVEVVVHNLQFRGGHYNFVLVRDITERKQAEEALQRSADRLRVFREIDQSILAARSTEEIAEAALQRLRQLVPCQRASVAIFDLEAGQATVIAADHHSPSSVGEGMRFSIDVFGESIEALRQGEVLAVEDILRLWRPSPLIQALLADGVRSSLNVPLIAQEDLMGSLNLGADSPGFFEPEHVSIAREVAEPLAIGIRQARLYEQVRQHAVELERRVAERTTALLQAEKLTIVGKLAASLAHEINNPLQAVIGCLGLAEETVAGGEDPGRYLEVALDELRRVARIVRQLRDLQRSSAIEEREPTDVNALLGRVGTLSRKQCEDQGVEVVWDTAVDLPMLTLAPDRIQQVFLNLVLNALDAMPQGGRLEVRTTRTSQPPGVSVSLADSGVGIPPEVLARIFEPFYSTKRDGLGLGLFISHEIVERHGGHVDVESRVGEGTTFKVWLPA
jgi:PAS domain S-box-containing protein